MTDLINTGKMMFSDNRIMRQAVRGTINEAIIFISLNTIVALAFIKLAFILNIL